MKYIKYVVYQQKNPQFPRGSSLKVGSVLLSPCFTETTETMGTMEITERKRRFFWVLVFR